VTHVPQRHSSPAHPLTRKLERVTPWRSMLNEQKSVASPLKGNPRGTPEYVVHSRYLANEQPV